MIYKKKYEDRIKQNKEKVLKDINTQDMIIKITNWANKFGYDFDTIKEKIKSDEIFRCVFIKDPAKQNLYQNIAAEFISNIKNVKNFQTLPQGGSNAIYVINGNIFKGNNLPNKNQDAKSIDFYFEYFNYKFYVSHKYTKDEGGAQDNQYKDLQHFLKNACDCNEKNTIFIAISDGEYYQRKDSKTKDPSRIERLKRLTDNKTVFVITINELEHLLEKYNN